MGITSSAPSKSGFVKQYEKFSTFLRDEVCSKSVTDFAMKKGLEHLGY
jgi:hypothetical protein